MKMGRTSLSSRIRALNIAQSKRGKELNEIFFLETGYGAFYNSKVYWRTELLQTLGILADGLAPATLWIRSRWHQTHVRAHMYQHIDLGTWPLTKRNIRSRTTDVWVDGCRIYETKARWSALGTEIALVRCAQARKRDWIVPPCVVVINPLKLSLSRPWDVCLWLKEVSQITIVIFVMIQLTEDDKTNWNR